MKILDKLRGLKGAAAFAAEIPNLEKALADARAEHQRLLAGREDVLFGGGEGALDKHGAAIERSEKEIGLIEIALAGARRRHADAVERERNDALDARAAEVRAKLPELERAYRAFDKHAAALAEAAATIKAIRGEIWTANAELQQAGRADLALSDPLAEVQERAGRQVRDPIAELRVPEYWPPHPDGPALTDHAPGLGRRAA